MKYAAIGTLMLLSALCCVSCTESTLDPSLRPDGRSYFYPGIGRYTDYQVLEIRYDEVNDNDTLRYQLREWISRTFPALGGGENLRLERFTRANATENWQLDSVWTARIEEGRIVRTESNTPYIQASLPVSVNRSWDRNALNPAAQFPVNITEAATPFAVGEMNFTYSLHLQARGTSSLISRQRFAQVYADSIGLVHYLDESVRFISNTENPFYGQDSIIGGRLLVQEIIGFGLMEP